MQSPVESEKLMAPFLERCALLRKPRCVVNKVETEGPAVAADVDHARLDALERAMLDSGMVGEHPVEHRFTPGLYIRKRFNPAGSILTTQIHKTEHPYFVVQGRVSVVVAGQEPRELEAPFYGITQAGTRRVIAVHEDTVWITIHALTPEEEAEPDLGQRLQMIENRIIERRELSQGKTAKELYEAALEIATAARALAIDLNPEKCLPPIDSDGLGRAVETGLVADAVLDEAIGHMGEFGLDGLKCLLENSR